MTIYGFYDERRMFLTNSLMNENENENETENETKKHIVMIDADVIDDQKAC